MKEFITRHFPLLLLALGACLLVGLGWKMNSVIAERDECIAARIAAESAAAGLAEELAANRKALAEREGQIKKLDNEAKALKGKLNDAYEADPQARAWADCALPDAVACLLR